VFVARLRAAGFPPAAVRALLNLVLDERYAAREREIHPSSAYVPPWQPRPPMLTAKAMAERETAANAMYKERDDLLRRLLGPEYVDREDVVSLYRRRQFGDIGPDKMDQVQALLVAQGTAQRELLSPSHYAGGATPNAPEVQEKRKAIDQEFRTQLARLLTPQELQHYDRWTSETAQKLRQRLQTFNASEQEFLALYRLNRPIDDQYSQWYGELPADRAEARKRAEAGIEEQIKAALGPERYADYQQATAPEHETLNLIVSRLGLPLSTARTVAGMQADIAQRAGAIRADSALSPVQRDAQLATLTREAESRIQQTLGPRGLDAFRQYQASWLRTFTAQR
jgi:hypothetical protein